jgi:hypothetical protein
MAIEAVTLSSPILEMCKISQVSVQCIPGLNLSVRSFALEPMLLVMTIVDLLP